jgi:hypothetical protein
MTAKDKDQHLIVLFHQLNKALKGLAVEISLISKEFKTPQGFREFEVALAEFEAAMRPSRSKQRTPK